MREGFNKVVQEAKKVGESMSRGFKEPIQQLEDIDGLPDSIALSKVLDQIAVTEGQIADGTATETAQSLLQGLEGRKILLEEKMQEGYDRVKDSQSETI